MTHPLVDKLRHYGALKNLSGRTLSARMAMAEAAELLDNLGEVQNQNDVDKGWRIFWGGFSRHLDLVHKQRVYTWHELMDACRAGIRASEILVERPHSQEKYHQEIMLMGSTLVTLLTFGKTGKNVPPAELVSICERALAGLNSDNIVSGQSSMMEK